MSNEYCQETHHKKIEINIGDSSLRLWKGKLFATSCINVSISVQADNFRKAKMNLILVTKSTPMSVSNEKDKLISASYTELIMS